MLRLKRNHSTVSKTILENMLQVIMNLTFLSDTVFNKQKVECCSNSNLILHNSGGRSSQAIVDGAMNALRALVKDRLSGKSGGSSYKQVEELLQSCEIRWEKRVNALQITLGFLPSERQWQRWRQQAGCGGAHWWQLWQHGSGEWRRLAGGVLRPLVWSLQEVSLAADIPKTLIRFN